MSSPQPKYISAEEVEKLLTWPLVNEAVEEALKATGQTDIDPANPLQSYAVQPARSSTPCGDRTKLLMCMPGYVGNYQLADDRSGAKKNTIACKLVTSFASNHLRNPPVPNILANILLFNTETGQLQCITDGTQITAWRTAAASVVATKYLYFKRFPEGLNKAIKLAIIGCGVQGESHALGMCKTFNVIDVYLYNRTKAKAEKLSDKLKAEGVTRVHVCDSADKAVQEADVVCVGTYSPTALINYEMLKGSDVHINTVGAGQVHFGEVAQDIYDQSVVYVDSMVSAKVELKDLKARIMGEVGEVIRNGKRTENERITIYQSMGIAAEDATVAQAIYDATIKDKKSCQ